LDLEGEKSKPLSLRKIQGIAICSKDDNIICVLKKFGFFHSAFLDLAQGQIKE